MEPQYRHTQIGWVMIGIVAVVAALVLPRLHGLGSVLPFVSVVLGATLLLFGTLTVEIGADDLRVWFGPGLVRKRIPLGHVAGWQAVRNPWYSGWGIRLGPWGVLWNVSGFDAVELALEDGQRFRIGTDEPAELSAAIARAKGETTAVPPPAFGECPVTPGGSAAAARWALAVGLALAGLGSLFWFQMRPPSVAVRGEGFEVRSLFYEVTVPRAEIARVSLEPALPRVLLRTNGFAAAGTLRGRFRVEGLGEGRLYVEEGHPPYVVVRLRKGFVIVNFREGERTRALYEEMARAWPDRTEEAPPFDRPRSR